MEKALLKDQRSKNSMLLSGYLFQCAHNPAQYQKRIKYKRKKSRKRGLRLLSPHLLFFFLPLSHPDGAGFYAGGLRLVKSRRGSTLIHCLDACPAEQGLMIGLEIYSGSRMDQWRCRHVALLLSICWWHLFLLP